jgi:hypothetical protein
MINTTCFRLAAAVAIFGFASPTALAAQNGAADAWKLVPAAPTSCYADDDFNDRLTAASRAIAAAIEQQTTVNAELRQRFDNLDMAEKAQRMQAFMMKNPQQAMKMMQAEQAAGAAATTSVTDANESMQRLEAEQPRLNAGFTSAVDQAVKPIQARQTQLIETKTVKVGEASIPMFTAAADHAQYADLVQQENAQYEKACALSFGAGGTLQKWLTSYRAEVIDRLIAAGEAGEGAMAVQMAIMDTPSAGYRSTAALEGARNYVQKLRNVYSIRRNKARPVVELRRAGPAHRAAAHD